MTVSFQDINILNVLFTIASEFSMYVSFKFHEYKLFNWPSSPFSDNLPVYGSSKLATTHVSHADTDAAFARWVAFLTKLSSRLAQPIQGCERPVCTLRLLWHWRFVC